MRLYHIPFLIVAVLIGLTSFVMARQAYLRQNTPPQTYCFAVEYITGTVKIIQLKTFERTKFKTVTRQGSYALEGSVDWAGQPVTVVPGVVRFRQIGCK